MTGAARGIGAATAQLLLDRGDVVVGFDVLPGKLPGRYHHLVGDVSVEGDVRRLFEWVDENHGRVDVLANIAGVVVVKDFLDTTWDDYRRATDVNLGGTLLACRYAVPLMPPGSAIVNMASISGHIGQTQHVIYSATKAAVIAMGRGLAWELAPRGIRVVSVSPGSVDTEMLRSDIQLSAAESGLPYEEVKAKREAEQALGRWAQPDEIAHAVAFLASGEASFITGVDLLVDAGWVAR